MAAIFLLATFTFEQRKRWGEVLIMTQFNCHCQDLPTSSALLVVCVTPLVLMNIYTALWRISLPDTRYFFVVCYAVAAALALDLFFYPKKGID